MNSEIFAGNLPSDILNPFKVDCIENISISYGKLIFTKEPYFSGKVSFKNGNTKGEQQFDGNSLTDVFIKVMNFCKELEGLNNNG